MLNVLYVEDDAGSRNVMRMIQRMNPGLMMLVMFEDSEDFEQRLLELEPQPAVIFLDIRVKPYTGFDMLGIIQSHRQYDGVPVIGLTASVMNEEILILKNAGFSGVFSKPVDMDLFPDLLKQVMEGKKLWQIW